MSAFRIPGLSLTAANVYCIGRNYADHAKELGNPVPAEPVVFMKPTASLLDRPTELSIPTVLGRVDHEAEIVIAMGEGGRIGGLGVGLDLTGRDLQDRLKAKSLPWLLAKGRRGFGPLSEFVAYDATSMPLDALKIEFQVNGETRQKGSTAELLFPIPRLIEFLHDVFGLQSGDLIFTGTPAGVGPLKSGDQLRMVGEFGAERVTFESRVV